MAREGIKKGFQKSSETLVSLGRGEKTRTSDHLHPMQVR
jgi:hypothetical protein